MSALIVIYYSHSKHLSLQAVVSLQVGLMKTNILETFKVSRSLVSHALSSLSGI